MRELGDDLADFIREARSSDFNEIVHAAQAYMMTHLGCTPKEIARAIGVSTHQARRAFRRVRATWGPPARYER